FILALLYVLFKAGMYWILRQIMLVICIVAAPLALAARLLPGTQQYYNKWKTITMSTLINQILFAFILALGMGMLNYAVTSNHGASGFMSALVELGIAIGLFWYTTKFPQKAAPELNAAVENLTKQGLTRARSGLGAIRKARER